MRHTRIFISLWSLLLGTFYLTAQEEDTDDLGIQEVTVIKSYSPSLKNVFKIRMQPYVDDSLIQKKQKIEYTFEPIPVVSTFIPNKASPLKLQRQESTFYHNSYFSGGFGNQSHPQFIFSSMLPLDRTQSIGLKFYYSAVGAIKNTLLNSDQKRTSLDLMHQYKQNHMRVDSDLRYDRQGHNFFGLYDLNWESIPSFRPKVIDPSQNLNYLTIRSRWQWYDSVVSKVDFNTHITTDSFNSTEHIVKINTQLRIPFLRQYIELSPLVELINTHFDRSYFSEEALNTQSGLGRLDLQFLSIGRKLKLRVGAKGFFPFGDSKDNSSFLIYPKVDFSYTTNGGKLVPHLKYQGSYDLNSFTSFSLQNPYVSPTLMIKPTQVNHSGVLGFNAYPGSGLSFGLNAHYNQSDDFPLFKRLPYDHNNRDEAYRLSNSYKVIYESIEKMGFVTRIAMQFSEYNKISLETTYNEYKREGGKKVWNLPALTIDFDANFRLGKKIFFQLGGNFMGARDSVRSIVVPSGQNDQVDYETIETVDSVFSISSSVTWKINPQWDLFYESNMNLGKNTAQWAHYQNQRQLHLGGIRYKFDINL